MNATLDHFSRSATRPGWCPLPTAGTAATHSLRIRRQARISYIRQTADSTVNGSDHKANPLALFAGTASARCLIAGQSSLRNAGLNPHLKTSIETWGGFDPQNQRCCSGPRPLVAVSCACRVAGDLAEGVKMVHASRTLEPCYAASALGL